MFNDPEIDKLIIFGLLGLVGVLILAVIFLAISRNIYYVNDEGEEVPPPARKKKRKAEPEEEEPVQEEPEPVAALPAPEPAPAPEPVPARKPAPAPEPVPVRKPAPAPEPAPVRKPAPVTVAQILEEKEVPAQTKQVPVTAPAQPAKSMSIIVSAKEGEFTRDVSVFPCVFGRDKSCNVVVNEPAVSRRHARVVLADGVFYIEDLAGHNGTFLNGRKLNEGEQARLAAGDRINIGRSQIVLRSL
jgi:hypothetical protein